MERGEVWTAAGGADYAGKPRPIVIVQSDMFPLTQSVTTCSFTTNLVESDIFRIAIEPSDLNGLKSLSHIMVDNLTTIPRSKLGRRIGRPDRGDIARLDEAMVIFLGLAG